ncbi:hypothetical protein C6N75_05085 [Streptomyces solincola]|uniref:Metalloprotease n=1 Tax=Streptomyces solincola TaxID=2100817 RepID=A0A2S9Q0Z2_9ACTN|nr:MULTISPECIES: protealysin inhibitor emfourin [Streptomyces]PRH80302.1 hypothetical protein C6N75_05085 [Streptomyces solincola]
MRISVTRAGGFAGIERRASVDTAARPDAAAWHALAEQALADGPRTPPSAVPDGFTYTIAVDGRTVRCADPALTDAQRELVSRVLGEGA